MEKIRDPRVENFKISKFRGPGDQWEAGKETEVSGPEEDKESMAVHKPHFESGSWRNTADMRIFFLLETLASWCLVIFLKIGLMEGYVWKPVLIDLQRCLSEHTESPRPLKGISLHSCHETRGHAPCRVTCGSLSLSGGRRSERKT